MENMQFAITGMHCQACATKIRTAIESLSGVEKAEVTLSPPRASLTLESSVSDDELRSAVHTVGDYDLHPFAETEDRAMGTVDATVEAPKESLYPLLLIVGFIAGVTLLIGIRTGRFEMNLLMTNFMAGFFLVFGFFKLLDLPGFVQTYRTYDLVAIAVPPWAWAYPFVELTLGAAYLLHVVPAAVNVTTLVLMIIGALGVVRALTKKQRIRCACLGTVLNLPMTTVTLVEDLGMAAMAGTMLAVQLL